MDTAPFVCDAWRMSEVEDRRAEMSDVEAPGPPAPFTVLEVFSIQKLVREQLRRAEKRARANAESGRELPGEDANVGRLQAYGDMDDKLEAWLQESWPLVDAAQAAAVGEGEGETVGEARWNAIRHLESQIGEVDQGRVDVVVVSEGKRGLLGIGQEPAMVMARLSERER